MCSQHSQLIGTTGVYYAVAIMCICHRAILSEPLLQVIRKGDRIWRVNGKTGSADVNCWVSSRNLRYCSVAPCDTPKLLPCLTSLACCVYICVCFLTSEDVAAQDHNNHMHLWFSDSQELLEMLATDKKLHLLISRCKDHLRLWHFMAFPCLWQHNMLGMAGKRGLCWKERQDVESLESSIVAGCCNFERRDLSCTY